MQKKWQARLAPALCSALLLLPIQTQAKDLAIIYIPLDNRPVCLDYVQQTLEATGCTLMVPPEKYLASNTKDGNPDKIWKWLQNNAPEADAAVISTDSLIYGGLVASRTHNLEKEVLQARVRNLSKLKERLPIKLYAFSTIMRTPRASYGRTEPPYYSKVGSQIFAYSQLLDKESQGKLTAQEHLSMQELEKQIGKCELADWLERRKTNYRINEDLVRLSRNGKFYYLAFGKDDNAPLSSTHMEARHISLQTFGMSKDDFQIIDGVDQLGLLLITRAYNEAHGSKPAIYPLYSPGAGQTTLPQYSDSRLQDSVPVQITAAGATIAPTPAQADLVLALNAPADGVVKNTTADDNQPFASIPNKRFAVAIEQELDAGRAVSLADISYSNGADNGFMELLSRQGIISGLQAYNAWNTADNAVGYAISQGILAQDMDVADKDLLLRQRLIDDWFYQSNARPSVINKLAVTSYAYLEYDLGKGEEEIGSYINQQCQKLAKHHPATRDSQFEISFPWQRLFEVNVKMKK